MTVLQVCAYGAEYPGNFIAALEKLEQALEAKGIHTIYAFIDRAADKDWCKNIQARTKVYFLPEAKARILPKTYRIFQQIYAENQVSVVHSHFELYDIPATVTAPKQARIFWHLHDAIGEGYSKSGMLHRILTRLQYGVVGRKATLLTVSHKHGDFARSIGFPGDQIIYTPNGIDTRRIKFVELDPGSVKFVMLGWDILRKGVDIAIKAARNLRHDRADIAIVGYDSCKEFLSSNQAPAIIRCQEPVKDINLLYGDARAFLHISRAEGLSYALLEVIYAGLPVICSDIPENRFAEAFQCIRFIRSENDLDVAEAIDEILDGAWIPTPAQLEHNRALIEDQFSLNAWCRTIMGHYGV